MHHLLNNFEIHCSNDYQYHINDQELQTSANHIVISRFRDLQEKYDRRRKVTRLLRFLSLNTCLCFIIFSVLSFVNVLVLNKLSKEGITSKI